MTASGIGGIFFKAQDPEALGQWYEEHLGLRNPGHGVVFGWRDIERPDQIGHTIWSPFSADTSYFEPSEASWMINFRVDDLYETLERLEAAGVELAGKPEEFEYGKFGWVVDPEGNKIELWEPPVDTGFVPSVPAGYEPGFDGEWACPPGTTVAAAGDLSDRTIVNECTVALPSTEVWRLWTTGEGMAEWWAEHNDIELRVGGPMELYMLPDAPEGSRGSDDCKILSFLPERMLSFTWNSPPDQPYTRPRHTHVVVEFEAVSDDETLVRLSHLGWPEEDWQAHPDEWQETYDYFDAAWESVLELLERHASS
jgi:uncharacterized protein YndB with AHSA1/START domain/catechol 2,3-dioxygenase-like lactoylglutathione lyase family enzyme